jgi:hypothetical protein
VYYILMHTYVVVESKNFNTARENVEILFICPGK